MGPRGQRGIILLVEDDPGLRFGLGGALRMSGYEVLEAATIAAARAALDARPDVVLVDLQLPDGDGLDLVAAIRRADDTVETIVVTGHATIDLAVRALKEGAADFLTKPVEVPRLLDLAARSVAKRKISPRASGSRIVAPFISTSPAVRRLEEDVERLRETECSVLILGETGTGKSLLARRLHAVGQRSTGPFVDINCAGLTRELLETELFGHERGAFTGAHSSRPGLLEAAHGGTLFLDEIGDIDLQVQAKILKVVEEKRYRRVGDVRQRDADVRLLAATHHDLFSAIDKGHFRADLFYRIATVTLVVPPLRERRMDIVPLARDIMDALPAAPGALTPTAEAALTAYDWPGNIRELRNVIERTSLLRRAEPIRAEDLGLGRRPGVLRAKRPSAPPPAAPPVSPPSSCGATLRDFEKQHIVAALEAENGRVEAAARRLGVPRSTLYQRIREFGLTLPRARRKGG